MARFIVFSKLLPVCEYPQVPPAINYPKGVFGYDRDDELWYCVGEQPKPHKESRWFLIRDTNALPAKIRMTALVLKLKV